MLLQSLYFSRFLPNRPRPRPRPLSSFQTHASWQPVTQSPRSRRPYGKIKDCEQSKARVTSNTVGKREFLWANHYTKIFLFCVHSEVPDLIYSGTSLHENVSCILKKIGPTHARFPYNARKLMSLKSVLL